MSRAKREDGEAIGYDSFLDVVANLVGILIILVVVVGAQAGSVMDSQQTESQKQLAEQRERLSSELAVHRRQAISIEQDTVELEARLQQERMLAERASQERDRLQRLVVLGEQALEEQRSRLVDDQSIVADQNFQLASLTRELDEMNYELQQINAVPQPTAVLEHHCTPLAQTVFNREIHFRLHQGLLAYVPMDDLVNQMTEQFPFQLEKLKTAPEITDTVGPIDEFRLQYVIRKEDRAIPTELGVMRRTVPQFVGFILLPTRPVMGQTIEESIGNPQSALQQRIGNANPAETTITIWVYPDSYHQYLTLENWLHERGFLVASWPLPADRPIAGGPNGLRSSAQ